jgi:membrane-associated protease RseP (regulator of RpoE activity)
MKLSPTRAALWLALAVALAVPAAAQEWTAAPDARAPTAAQQKELDAARAQLDAAAKRYGELAGKYGVDPVRFKVEQRLLRKPVIGVVLAPDESAGVRIAGVTPDSAAAVAGVKSGDRIVAIDDRSIAGADPEVRVEVARDAIGKHGEKSKVKLQLERDGKKSVVMVAPRAGERMMFIPGPGADAPDVRRNVEFFARPDGNVEFQGADVQLRAMPAIAPDVRKEIVLLGPDGACKGEHCKLPVIADALRWNGLNLASVDDGLGRYFGADDGVLVLSTGPELEGLEAGDVIRSVDGKAVKSPRDVMEALRGRDAGSKVAVAYLRDRKAGTAQVTVPEPMPFRIPAPPAPPAPPAAPVAPIAPPPPPPAAPMAPAAPRAPGFAAPAPPAAPTPPPAPPAPPAPPVD